MGIIIKVYRFVIKIFCWISNAYCFRTQGVVVGHGLIINGKIRIINKGAISLGRNVRINSSYRSVPIGGGDYTSIVVCENAELRIGDGSGISNSAIYVRNKITIGDDVFIGGGCRIYDSDFHSLNLCDRLLHEREININSKEVEIKRGAFIGGGSIILKGVVIGEEAIVGAGSVVSRSIPPKEVWAGNPAKKIR